jgi:hypothetical protein
MPRDTGNLSAFVNEQPAQLELTSTRPKTARAVIRVRPSAGRRVTSIVLRCEHLSVASETDPRMIGMVLAGAVIRPSDTPA